MDAGALADDLMAELHIRLSANPEATSALGAVLSNDKPSREGMSALNAQYDGRPIDITALWWWLLEATRVAFGYEIHELDRRRSSDFIDCIAGAALVRVDRVLSLLAPEDQEWRMRALVALTSLIDGEILSCIESGGAVMGWDPKLDSANRIRAVMSRAGMMSAYHHDLVDEATRRFELHLGRLETHEDPSVRRTANRFGRTYSIARAHGLALDAEHVDISPDVVRDLPLEHRGLFVNQWALGMGRDDSPVVVLGAEAAYNVERDADLVNFCTESIGNGVVWLSGGKGEVVRALSGGAVSTTRPLHIHPNDHYREGQGHTWGRLGLALGHPGVHEPERVPGLGDICYQIELSAHPSQENSGSEAPTRERKVFLRSVMEKMQSTARVLLIHGSRSSPAHEDARYELASAFLGVPSEDALTRPHAAAEPGYPIFVADADGRRVIKTRALSQSSNEFLARIAELIHEVL